MPRQSLAPASCTIRSHTASRLGSPPIITTCRSGHGCRSAGSLRRGRTAPGGTAFDGPPQYDRRPCHPSERHDRRPGRPPPRGITRPAGGQSRPCSYARAVAAARDGTRSFARMLLTCRSTVRSLSTSRVAIARFVSPAATSRSTSSSRGAQAAVRRPRRAAATASRASSGCAPSSANTAAAASCSIAAASSSPSARHAAASRTRVRAASYGACRSCHSRAAVRRATSAAGGVAVGEVQRAARVGGDRRQHAGVVVRRHALELRGGVLGRLAVAGGERDLDAGRQQAPPPCRVALLREARGRSRCARRPACPAPSAAGPGRAAARSPAGSRRGRPPRPRRGRRAGGGSRPDGSRRGGGAGAAPLLEPSRGALGLGQRVVPGALLLQHLRTVQQAVAREGDQRGLAVAPRLEGVRPRVRAPQLAQLLAAGEHAAVEEARDDGRELAVDDGDHRLVDAGEPLRHAALADQREALLVRGEGEQVGVAEARGDARRLRRRPRRRRAHSALATWRSSTGSSSQPSSTHGSARAAEQPLGARDPAGREHRVVRHQQQRRARTRSALRRAGAPASACAWWARVRPSTTSSSRPSMYAQVASSSRSAGSRPPAASAAQERAASVRPGAARVGLASLPEGVVAATAFHARASGAAASSGARDADPYSGSSGSPAVQPPSTGITWPVTRPGRGRAEERDHARDVRRLADAAQRDAPHRRPVHGLDLQHRRRHGRPDEGRADGVDADAVAGPVDGEAAGQRGDGALRRGVGGLARQRDQRRLRGHEHDAAGAGRDHRALRDGHRPVERALHVDGPQAVEVGLVDLLGRHVGADHAGAARQRRDGAELRRGAVGRGLDGGPVGHVAAQRQRAAAAGLDQGHGLGLSLGIEVDAGHVGALAGERDGDRLADALRGAGHDGRRAREVEGDRELVSHVSRPRCRR